MVKEIPIKMLVTLLRSRRAVVVRLATRFVKYLYTELLGFPRRTPATSCVSAVIRAGTTKFPLIRTQVNFLKETNMPILVAWALDDVLVEPEIPKNSASSHTLAHVLNSPETRVEQVTAAMSSWIQSILSGCNSLETGMTHHLPEAYIKTVFAVNQQQYSILSFLPSRKKLIPRGSRAAPPPLPLPEYIEMKDRCKIEYVDIQPKTDNTTDKPATIVVLHGAPGSYQDFRYLIPLVQRPGVRIVGINLPGYEGSTVAKSHYLESISALPTAQLTFDALQQLTSTSESVFLLGHSFGAQTAINMAALKAAKSRTALNIRGLALLAPSAAVPIM
ncbi:Alpha/Beta hydrolase fold [Phytophthora cactorum]|nr:Alpha/Beta hydrolase fold [Phytophthora cactorum]